MILELDGNKFECLTNNKEIIKAYIIAYIEKYNELFNPMSQIVFKEFKNNTFKFKAGSYGGRCEDFPTIESYALNLSCDVFDFVRYFSFNFNKTQNNIIISQELTKDKNGYYWYEAEMTIKIL